MTLPKEVMFQFSELWRNQGWVKIEPSKVGDRVTFKKSCELFGFFVSQDENYDETYIFAVEDGGGTQVFSTKFEVVERGDSGDTEALRKADQFIQEFINASILAWMGFEITPTRPADEIRFKQIAGSGSKLMGLADDGKVYFFTGKEWEPQPMKVKSPID